MGNDMGKSCDMACDCGRVTWTVKNASKGRHIKCYCESCRTAIHHLGKAETRIENGGTHLFQTVPHNMEITSGSAHLIGLRLSPHGTYRWYASCCNTPIATTLHREMFPFVGIALRPDDTSFGKVASHFNTKDAPNPVKQTGFVGTVGSALIGAMSSWLQGKSKITPFFDPDGTTRAKIKVLTLEEREAARKG